MTYALIDPNWGEPIPVLGTIRDSEEMAWAAAVSPKADPNCRLYSGASEYPLPYGTPGHVDTLKRHGFDVRPVVVKIETHKLEARS